MTAGTSNRRAATSKSTELNDDNVGVQPAEDQMDYAVQVDDKLGMHYADGSGRSWNKTILAKLVHYEDEDTKRRRVERPSYITED